MTGAATLIEDSLCPGCQSTGPAWAERDTGSGSPVPEPGDIGVCTFCGTAMIFEDTGGTLRLREATLADMEILPPEHQKQISRSIAAALVCHLPRERN